MAPSLFAFFKGEILSKNSSNSEYAPSAILNFLDLVIVSGTFIEN